MTRFLPLILIVAISVSSAAAAFDSFPSHETAVSDPTAVAADHWQIAPSVAAGDGMFLVAWYQVRPTMIYAARVSGDGELLDTQPILIARDGIFPRAAWAGDRFLVA